MTRTGWALTAPFLLLAAPVLVAAPGDAGEPGEIKVVGDSIPLSLNGKSGDPERGRQVALARDRGNCGICHVIPGPDAASHGNVGPSLKGVADRLSEGQLRLRIVDTRRLNPASIMPAYFRVEGLRRVAAAYAGKPTLSADEIEDVIAFLKTLRKAVSAR